MGDGLLPQGSRLRLRARALELGRGQPAWSVRGVRYRERDPHQHTDLLRHPFVRERRIVFITWPVIALDSQSERIVEIVAKDYITDIFQTEKSASIPGRL